MEQFAAMYRARRFGPEPFDLEGGYLQTTLSDDSRMPLRFFTEYNNAWWFEIVTAIEVPAAAYDPASESGFIVLDIFYGPDVLRAAQHVHFAGNTISRIRTYASSAFFTGASPLVQLDRIGNTIWLESGYDLAASTVAARRFLDGPTSRGFAESEPTASAITRIRANVTALEGRLGTT